LLGGFGIGEVTDTLEQFEATIRQAVVKHFGIARRSLFIELSNDHQRFVRNVSQLFPHIVRRQTFDRTAEPVRRNVAEALDGFFTDLPRERSARNEVENSLGSVGMTS